MKIRAVSHGRLPFLTIAASDIGHDIMKKRNFCPMAAAVLTAAVILQPFSTSAGALGQIRSIAKSIISGEPKEVEELRPERRRASGILFQTAYGRRAESISGAAERNPCPGKGVLSDDLR